MIKTKHLRQIEQTQKWYFVVLLVVQTGLKNVEKNLFTEFQQLFHIMTKKHKNCPQKYAQLGLTS